MHEQKRFVPLARTVMLVIVAISIGIAAIFTSLEIALDYSEKLAQMDDHMSEIRKSIGPIIASHVWNADHAAVKLTLDEFINNQEFANAE